MSHRHHCALALAAVTLVAAGCGGSAKPASNRTASGGAGSTGTVAHAQPTAQLSLAALTDKADAICRRLKQERASTTIRTTRDYARLLPQLVAYERAAASELRNLAPPAAIAADWRQIVASVQTIADDTSEFAEYAQSHNLKAANALLTRNASAEKALSATAKRHGLTSCASIS